MGKQESIVERYLDSEIRKLGGVTRKYTSPGHKGVADRLCFVPDGKLYIVEVKADYGKEYKYQKRERTKMLILGFEAVCVYGIKGVDDWLHSLSYREKC